MPFAGTERYCVAVGVSCVVIGFLSGRLSVWCNRRSRRDGLHEAFNPSFAPAGGRRYCRLMSGETDRAHVRLAELVAALSLGIDLGFGQPMEHVLRQCLIALRLAERIGLPDQERSAVYYTALLVNVGCHSDAHEQAKWFGDDIALKSGKYDRSVRGAV